MARFGSTASFYANNVQYRAGQTYADTRRNAIGNDVVWSDLSNSSSMSPALVPLDASAITIFSASRFVGMSTLIDGMNSTGG